MPSETVSVTKVTSKTVPVVSFVNGIVRESRKRRLSVGLFKDTNRTGKKKNKIVVAESSKMVYQGSNFGPLGTKAGSSQLYVAEVDTDTGKMTLFPAEMYKLHPTREVNVKTDRLDLESMSFRDKADALTDAFGSGKQKRALARRQRNKLAEGAVSDAMGSIIDSAVVSQQAHTQATASQETSSAIPPFNKDAATPAEVYDLHSIISETEMENLRNAAHDFFESDREKIAEWDGEKKYFPSVLSRVRIMPMEEEARWKTACCLLYLQYLMTLYLTKYDQLRKKDPLPAEWPDMIKHFMLKRFTLTVDKKRCVPARMRDLMLSHIIVLCLIVDDFTVSLEQLQTDLKLSANKLLTHVRALGCKVKTETTTDSSGLKTKQYMAKLTVPLTFPEPSKGRKSK